MKQIWRTQSSLWKGWNGEASWIQFQITINKRKANATQKQWTNSAQYCSYKEKDLVRVAWESTDNWKADFHKIPW